MITAAENMRQNIVLRYSLELGGSLETHLHRRYRSQFTAEQTREWER
ncbi:hypothetical protein RSSM_04118 [Rhodopirellula sallentina SM41]|uniref:Uncharacterized protein n=1 Tax=Rhodopirellula sallentina SM41 TaxID=1263870 RepID=M5TYW0_9BACT|nr:hypothetical protein RSSM_04118 [Rhodopirellula sallentina SM41]